VALGDCPADIGACHPCAVRSAHRATTAQRGAGNDEVLNAELGERPESVRPQADPRTRASPVRASLEHGHIPSGPRQRQGRRQASDARTDNDHLTF
jgi:hypothetical protein